MNLSSMIVWSYGGGTQSIAIALLIHQGKLPMPDLIVMADTGREASETWDYTEQYVKPLGFAIEIVKHDLATVDLYSKNERHLLIPAYTKESKLSNFCSYEWKLYVIRRYLRSKGVQRCVMWLGISTDEVERLKPSDVKWIETRWPLCFDVPMSRAECKQLILNFGWPEPPKSSCWMCPHRRNPQWKRLKEHFPEDFAKAVQLDRDIRARDTKGGVWLHESRQPLDEVDFLREDQPELFGCESGYCWV